MPLREIAKQSGIDDNDPLLVRALEAQDKATDWITNPISWLDMEAAVWDFIEARFEIEDASTQVIEGLLQELQNGEATPIETEQFRWLADHALRTWEPESWSPNLKERTESTLSRLAA